jgi:hypothetical protein
MRCNFKVISLILLTLLPGAGSSTPLTAEKARKIERQYENRSVEAYIRTAAEAGGNGFQFWQGHGAYSARDCGPLAYLKKRGFRLRDLNATALQYEEYCFGCEVSWANE